MQIIINMLDLKKGEIWLEIVQSLQRGNMKLVDTDMAALQRYFKISQNKVAVVIDTQRYLIRRAKEDVRLSLIILECSISK